MTTFVSLASSATMLPVLELGKLGKLGFSTLTPELVKARLAYPGVSVSALNPSHATTIDVIKRRYDLELPIPVLAPSQRAPQIQLRPGDELFIVQASLPRLNEGETHSDATVQSAPISFLRWRLPVDVAPGNVYGVPQSIYADVVDHAHSIALWRRGETWLQDTATLKEKFDHEIEELKAAAEHWNALEDGEDSQESLKALLDLYLEGADVLYYALQHWHVTVSRHSGYDLVSKARSILDHSGYDLVSKARSILDRKACSFATTLDIMLAKYSRRAAGQPKDIEAERRLAAPLIPRTAQLYA